MNSSLQTARRTVFLIALLFVSILATSAAAAGSAYKITLTSPVDQLQGNNTFVDAVLSEADTTRGLTGFDFTIAYDRAALNFREALPGAIITDCDWEYFGYQWGRQGDCHGDCPEGVMRIVGTASLTNGLSGCNTPIPGVGTLPKSLFTLKFLITSDRSFQCSIAPVYWYWMDCHDNILTTTSLDEQIISRKIFSGYDGIYPPYQITDSVYPGYPTHFGAQVSCSHPATGTAVRLADFYNSYISIICPETINYRGDVNLSGINYEIGDFTLLKSYFLRGASVFTIDSSMQVATTDANADGVTLHVSDLVFIGLVIEGLAFPQPKVVPTDPDPLVRVSVQGDTLNLDAKVTVGAMSLIFDGVVDPILLRTDVRMDYLTDGSVTRVLFTGKNDYFPAKMASGPLLKIANLAPPNQIQATDTNGYYLFTAIDTPTDVGDGKGSNLPAAFSLDQNYPNPFNPTTTISFTLPRSTSYTLTIYTMTGQEVARFAGTAGPGVVRQEWDGSGFASGVYLYKLTAGSFSDAKKMLLVK